MMGRWGLGQAYPIVARWKSKCGCVYLARGDFDYRMRLAYHSVLNSARFLFARGWLEIRAIALWRQGCRGNQHTHREDEICLTARI